MNGVILPMRRVSLAEILEMLFQSATKAEASPLSPQPQSQPFSMQNIPLDVWYRRRGGETIRRITDVDHDGIWLADQFVSFEQLHAAWEWCRYPQLIPSIWHLCETEPR